MRQKAFMISGWIVAGVVLLVGMAGGQSDRMRLRELEIVDSKGKACIKLKEMGGNPAILLMGPNSETVQAGFMVSEMGPAIAFNDPNNLKARIMLKLTPNGPTLSMNDKTSGRTRAMIAVENGGITDFLLSSGLDRASGINLSTSENGTGTVTLYDGLGKASFLP